MKKIQQNKIETVTVDNLLCLVNVYPKAMIWYFDWLQQKEETVEEFLVKIIEDTLNDSNPVVNQKVLKDTLERLNELKKFLHAVEYLNEQK